MRVLLIRHATAVPQGTPGITDNDRPLTPRGERRFRKAARGLARVARPPDALLTSPLPRALRTAQIAAQAWGRVKPRIEPALASGEVAQLLAVLAAEPPDTTVALVGHEPDLSALLAHLIHAADGERLALRKGGAVLVDVPDSPVKGGRLVFHLTPKLLRRLARD